MLLPCDDSAFLVESCLQVLCADSVVEPDPDVVFPRPLDSYRRIDLLRNQCGFIGKITFGLSAETATQQCHFTMNV